MYKKLSILGLVFLLSLYPFASLTAEEIAEDETNIETQEPDDTGNEESVIDEEDLDTGMEEAAGEDNDAIETEDGLDEPEENADSPEPTENEETTTEEEATTDEEEAAEEDNKLEENLDLSKIHGTIDTPSSPIYYDFNQGHYVLELRAGLHNMSRDQELNEKWLAFTLPDGVSIGGDLPGGVVLISLYGKDALAVKVPDVGPFPSSEYVRQTIPLLGEDIDQDPNLNLYLLNVDVESRTFEEIGRVINQRKIDFSVMENVPTLDLHGSITGTTSFDEDKGYHFLSVDVAALNETDNSMNDLFVGFTLPEGVVVLSNEDTPPHVDLLNIDENSREVLVKLPELRQDRESEMTYKIPLMGISDEVVVSSTIPVYRQVEGSYHQVGKFDGHISVDFSDMDVEWDFSVVSQIIRDYPGLPDDLFAMNFAFKVGNVTIDQVDEVVLEFVIPDDIQVQEPDNYRSGEIPDSLKDFLEDLNTGSENLDITWDGNSATIAIGDLDSISGYQGYFTAYGETDLNVNELEGLEVIATLYRDGEALVEEIYSPFEIVRYDGGDDGQTGGDDGQTGGDDGQTGGDDSQTGGDDGQTGGDDGQTGGDDGQTGGDNGQTGGDNNQTGGDNGQSGGDSSGSDSKGGKTKVTVEDGDDSAKDRTESKSSSQKDNGLTLPKTATNMYNMLLIGVVILLAGTGAAFVFNRKRTNE